MIDPSHIRMIADSSCGCAREFAEHDIDYLPVQSNMGFSRQKGASWACTSEATSS
jgi:hypothetical protein